MTNTAQTLQAFFGGFGIPAYVENTVPDDAVRPYITYELRKPDRLRQTSLRARIWYYDTGFNAVTAKANAIRLVIEGGHSIQTSDGALRIWPDDMFLQFEPPEEPEDKVAYLSMILETDYN